MLRRLVWRLKTVCRHLWAARSRLRGVGHRAEAGRDAADGPRCQSWLSVSGGQFMIDGQAEAALDFRLWSVMVVRLSKLPDHNLAALGRRFPDVSF
jgi:hypothetical protein